jgi:hypothetical protein
MAEGRLPKIALKWMPKQNRARGRPKKNWMEGIKKAMNERVISSLKSSENSRRKIAQNSIEMDAKTKESTRKTEEKLDGRNKEGHERKKPK